MKGREKEALNTPIRANPLCVLIVFSTIGSPCRRIGNSQFLSRITQEPNRSMLIGKGMDDLVSYVLTFGIRLQPLDWMLWYGYTARSLRLNPLQLLPKCIYSRHEHSVGTNKPSLPPRYRTTQKVKYPGFEPKCRVLVCMFEPDGEKGEGSRCWTIRLPEMKITLRGQLGECVMSDVTVDHEKRNTKKFL